MSQNCSNCYNGCVEIVSDRCVKYTGIDVPVLGIKTGDSLSYVEQAIITYLGSLIDGSGIKINIDEVDYCELVTQYLPTCQDITALDLFKALVKAACDLQEQIDVEKARIDTIEANYTVDCLEGVTSISGTHSILQATITKLCEVDASLALLATDVDTNYVKIADLNGYIAAYIASTTAATRYYTRLIPYTVVEYYGPLTDFDATGAGIVGSLMEKIYLCNGDNGTPDKRGRVTVGATSTPGVIPMSSVVDPAADPTFNPVYTLSTTAGSNKNTLVEANIPSHTHVATSVVSPNPHSHEVIGSTGGDSGAGSIVTNPPSTPEDGGFTETTALTVTTTLANTGGGQAHANIQPSIAAYFIMYIP